MTVVSVTEIDAHFLIVKPWPNDSIVRIEKANICEALDTQLFGRRGS